MAALLAELWIVGAKLVDPASGQERAAALRIEGSRIAGEAPHAPRGAKTLDAHGLWIVPAVIDAHVHLAFAGPVAEIARKSLRGGVAAVLDLGAPERLLPLSALPLRVRYAGPLFTHPGGYPTQSWGKDGYGLELEGPQAARAAVARLAGEGARFIKLAFDPRFPQLTAPVALAAAEEAHQRGLKVAAHALDVGSVRRALDAGADVLAHAPAERLPVELVREIGAKKLWVISTLQAFGASTEALENLRGLHAAGARIVYGTDLGNQGTAPGIDARELALLVRAGLRPLEILRAATSGPAALLDEPDLGRLSRGAAASLLALRRDPLQDPTALVAPLWVMIDGALQQ